MKIYIGNSNDTLEQIAKNHNVPYSLLLNYNKAYAHKHNLEGCTIVIPVEDENSNELRTDNNEVKPAILTIDNEQRLEPLIGLTTEYSYLLKELIITKYNNPTYTPIIFSSLKIKEEAIKKILLKERTDNPLAISQAQEYKDFSSTILLLITAIKAHGLDEVKKQLGHLKNWHKRIIILYNNDLQRDDTLKNTITELGENWRDYAIKYGAEKYEECEQIFSRIIDKLKKFALSILNK